MIAQFFAVLESESDSLRTLIPTLSDRFNFVLPLIVILFIFAFFLGLKMYVDNSSMPDGKRSKEV